MHLDIAVMAVLKTFRQVGNAALQIRDSCAHIVLRSAALPCARNLNPQHFAK